MDKKELIHCPFCGSVETDIYSDISNSYFYGVYLDCGTSGPTAITKEDARSKWNKRSENWERTIIIEALSQ